MQRQVYVSGRIKAMNESIYYTVDAIHNAISENRKIKFQYYQWNVKKEMELRHDGAWYHISPWGLSWDDENYYLVGYDSEAELIKHYRVDKMLHIRMSTEAREGKEHFKQLDMADYAKEKAFGMFGGKEKTVKLLVDKPPGRSYYRPIRKRYYAHTGRRKSFYCKCRCTRQQAVLGLGILTGRTGENTLARGRRRTDARRSEEAGRAVWGIRG